ncbi:MAG: redoxin domain-containing protein [Gemmatimonadota bacterium]
MTVAGQHALPAVGQEAPGFSLPSTGGGEVSLGDFRGKQNVLLAFFPLAFTSTCTAEMCEFSEEYARYESTDTAVLPISVDSVPTLRAFKAHEGLRLEMLSDFHREVARAYGVLKQPQFFAERAYILIDRRGVVRWAHVESELGTKRETADLMRAIAAA